MRRIFFLIAILIIAYSCEKEPTSDTTKYSDCLECIQINQKNIIRIDTCNGGFENITLYENYIDSLLTNNFDCQEQHNFIYFPTKLEKVLGEILKEHADSDTTFVILDKTVYNTTYNLFDGIVKSILSVDSVLLSDSLVWESFIIQDNSSINGFIFPGGKIYITTGLIKLLDNEAEIAGFLGHLIAHVDRGHTIKNLQETYGTSLIINVLETQDYNIVSQIINSYQLGLTLTYSRSDEFKADELAVKFLNDTEYNPLGIKNFWTKLMEINTMTPIHSLHPNPENRLENINNIWTSNGSKTGDDFIERYATFKNSLP